jgi:hypothetical protein
MISVVCMLFGMAFLVLFIMPTARKLQGQCRLFSASGCFLLTLHYFSIAYVCLASKDVLSSVVQRNTIIFLGSSPVLAQFGPNCLSGPKQRVISSRVNSTDFSYRKPHRDYTSSDHVYYSLIYHAIWARVDARKARETTRAISTTSDSAGGGRVQLLSIGFSCTPSTHRKARRDPSLPLLEGRDA